MEKIREGERLVDSPYEKMYRPVCLSYSISLSHTSCFAVCF